VAACVCFGAWPDGISALESVVHIRDVAPYQSGQFYRRELPCILAVLDGLSELPQVSPALPRWTAWPGKTSSSGPLAARHSARNASHWLWRVVVRSVSVDERVLRQDDHVEGAE
jgi:hypothetical protein